MMTNEKADYSGRPNWLTGAVEQVARLTRERDEALAKVERLRGLLGVAEVRAGWKARVEAAEAREAALRKAVEGFAQAKALANRALGRGEAERVWLDLLAVVERTASVPAPTAKVAPSSAKSGSNTPAPTDEAGA